MDQHTYPKSPADPVDEEDEVSDKDTAMPELKLDQ